MNAKVHSWLLKVEQEPLDTRSLRDTAIHPNLTRKDASQKPDIGFLRHSDFTYYFANDLEFQERFLLRLKAKNKLPNVDAIYHEVWDSHPEGSTMISPQCSLAKLGKRSLLMTCLPNFDKKALYAVRNLLDCMTIK